MEGGLLWTCDVSLGLEVQLELDRIPGSCRRRLGDGLDKSRQGAVSLILICQIKIR